MTGREHGQEPKGLADYEPAFFLYHAGTAWAEGPTLRATFSCANDAYIWQRGNVGQPYAEMFYITNKGGERVTFKDRERHPGHAYAILDKLDSGTRPGG